jgi:serine-type D-Ala-D-Ala carboxypeptidase/endopeptidase
MIRRCLACVALALVPFAAAAQKSGQEAALDAIVAERLGESESPACIMVGWVGETTRVSSGCTRGAGPVAFDRDSLFEIGSITKGFTGLLLADMVRKGELSLDDPAAKFAPPEAKLPAFEGRPIRLRDLVTHTSSLPRLPPGMNPANPLDPYADFSVDALYAALARTSADSTLGMGFAYSNFGFMWLSELLARRAGKPYPEVLTERVLAPLGMSHTSIPVAGADPKGAVIGHNVLYRPTPAWHLDPQMAGVGGLLSSMSDMLKLAEAMAGRRDTPLKESIALATQELRKPGTSDAIGYAWFVRERPGARVVWHNGGTGGFRSAIAVNASDRTGAVVLVDAAVSFDDLALHLVDASYPLMKKRVALPLAAQDRAQYAGDYELRPGFVIRVYVDGDRLMSRATNQGAIELLRDGADTFFVREVQARLAFRRDAEGKVAGLTLTQGGRDIPGKRIP